MKRLLYSLLLFLIPSLSFGGIGLEYGHGSVRSGFSVDANKNITVGDDVWIGLGSSAGRIVFDDQSTDEINFMNCNVGIGTATPAVALDVAGDIRIDRFLYSQSNFETKFEMNSTSLKATVYNEAMFELRQAAQAYVLVGNVDGGDIDISLSDSALYIDGNSGNVGIGATSPSERLHIDDACGDDGTGRWVTNKSATTTDATLTAIYTLGTTTDQDYLIEVAYIGAETDGTNEYYAKLIFAVSNVSGTVTEDSETDLFEDDNSAAAAADASGAVDGTDYLIQVTGVAAETWNWEVAIDVTIVAH